MSEPIRYEFIYNENFCSVEREEHPEGDYVTYDDYARLKAEVERLEKLVGKLCFEKDQSFELKQNDEATRLKAEVERLTLENSQYEEHHKYGQNVITSLREEVKRLKMNVYNRLSMRIEIDKLNARIEHLIKAGDLMADGINGDYNYSLPCIEEWEAAKKGGRP